MAPDCEQIGMLTYMMVKGLQGVGWHSTQVLLADQGDSQNKK